MSKHVVSHCQLSHVGLVFLLACSIPMFLSKLPSLPLLISLFGLVVFYACWKKDTRCTLLIVFFIGLIRFTLAADTQLSQQLPHHLAKQIFQFKAEVVSFPRSFTRQGNRATRFNVRVIHSSRSALLKSTTVTLACYQCKKKIHFGDLWNFSAKLTPIRGQASWSAFDYKKFVVANNIVAKGYIKQDQSNKLSSNESLINEVRTNIKNTLQRKLDGHSGGLFDRSDEPSEDKKLSSKSILLALSIGDRSGLTKENYRVFKESGISHLIAISGLHIGLIFLFVKVVFSSFVRLTYFVVRPQVGIVSIQNLSLIVALAASIFYAFMAGFTLPTQRAVIMLAIFCLARLCYWRLNLFTLLSVTVLLILIFKPLSVMLVGFWLSIAAVFMINIIIHLNTGKISSQLRLATAIIPITFIFFDGVSWVSPICNLFMIPVVGFIVVPSLFVLLIFDRFGLNMSSSWSALDELLQWIYAFVTKLTVWQNSLSLDVLRIDHWHVFLVSLLFSFLILSWALLPMKRLIVLLPTLLILAMPKINQLEQGEFLLTTLDVGQGLAVIIETASSVSIFDTGIGFSQSDSAEQVVIPYLRSRGIKQIDQIIVSHGDNDHIGGLNTLLNEFSKVKVLTTSQLSLKSGLFDACYDKKIVQDNVSFTFSPEVSKVGNNSSCVVHISSQFGSALLPGDIERKSEHRLLINFHEYLSSDVLVLPHHGSKTSSTPAFIHQVRPAIGIVSASYFSPHNHPHKSVVRRMRKYDVKLFSTATSGSIQVTFKKGGIHTREYRANNPRFWYSKG